MVASDSSVLRVKIKPVPNACYVFLLLETRYLKIQGFESGLCKR